MSNKSKLVTLLLIIVIVAGYYYYREWKTNQLELALNSYRSNEQLPLVTISTDNVDDPVKKNRLIIATPVINILDNKELSEKANSYIIRFISDQKEMFYKESEEDRLGGDVAQNAFSTISLTSEVLLVTPKVFAIKINQSTLLAHKSRAENTTHYIMFDLENGRPLMFEDIFGSPESVNVVEKYISENELNESYAERLKASLKTNNHINLDSRGLTVNAIISDENVSEIELTIPLSVIESYIDPNIKDLMLSEKEYIRMSEPEMAQ